MLIESEYTHPVRTRLARSVHMPFDVLKFIVYLTVYEEDMDIILRVAG